MKKRKFQKLLLAAAAVGIMGMVMPGAAGGKVCAAKTAQQSSLKLTMSAPSGCYESAFSLTISCPGASKIYYTTDGSNPVDSSTRQEYTSAITVGSRAGEANYLAAVDPAAFESDHATFANGAVGDAYQAPQASEVDKATVIRVAAVDLFGAYTKVSTNTYFIGTVAEHIQGIKESAEAAGMPLAVMSISVDYRDLFDDNTGIYVKGQAHNQLVSEYIQQGKITADNAAQVIGELTGNYKGKGKDWERAAHIDYLESSGETMDCRLQQDCGIRLQGGSRTALQKSFRLYARSSYGNKNFKYPFFGEPYKNTAGSVIEKFDRLTLRNGGGNLFSIKYNDAFWQSLLGDLKCDTQQARPCVVYLDGEYWGIYILQEDYSADYFEEKYGVVKDDVVLYQGDGGQPGYELEEGTLPDGVTDTGYFLTDLQQFFQSHADLKNQADYDAFTAMVDENSVKDFFAANIWMNNKGAWPAENWSMWKTVKTDAANAYADGKWRLCLNDLDNIGVKGAESAAENTIASGNNKKYGLLDMATDNPAVLCFAYLMSNETFRNSFAARVRELGAGQFAGAAASLEKYSQIYQPLFPQFFTRFCGASQAATLLTEAQSGSSRSYQAVSGFIAGRPANIETMLQWVTTFYQTHDTYKGGDIEETTEEKKEDEEKDQKKEEKKKNQKKKKIATLKVTAKKGKKVIRVKTIKKAKVKVSLRKKLIKKGKKKVKQITFSASKNKKGNVTVKLAGKLKKGMKITVTVSKKGYKTRKVTKKAA